MLIVVNAGGYLLTIGEYVWLINCNRHDVIFACGFIHFNILRTVESVMTSICVEGLLHTLESVSRRWILSFVPDLSDCFVELSPHA